MSHHIFHDDVLFLQRLLSCSGFYTDTIDGDWGPRTDAAERAFHQRCDAIADEAGRFDPRSERNIRSLRTDAQEAARRSIKRLRDAGVDARVISGTRSYAEQAALFRQGRFGDKRPIVTKARAGQSWHNFGLAWDIGIFDNGAYVTREQPYKAAGAHAKAPELEWGGDWKSFKDYPHYQLKQASGVSAARAFFEAGGRS